MKKIVFGIIVFLVLLFLSSNNIDKQKAQMQGGKTNTEKMKNQPKPKSHLKELSDKKMSE